MSHIGYNLKMTDMQAAVGCAQLEKVPGFIEKRKKNFSAIYDRLKKYDDKLVLPVWHPSSDPAWFGVPLTVKSDAGFDRNALTGFLEENLIERRNLFFFIGCYPGIDDARLSYMLEVFDRYFRRG